MSNFPNFAGRTREKERVWALVEPKLADVFSGFLYEEELNTFVAGMKVFLDKYYDAGVPYHGPVHVLYGLCFLLSQDEMDEEVLARELLLWLGHDAGHNGNAAESPEEKSMSIARAEFTPLADEALDINAAWPAILMTKFPSDLEEKFSDAECFRRDGRLLRVLDTLRIAAGGVSANALGLEDVDSFHVYLFECAGLWQELGMEPEAWLRKGQLGFFFQHLRACCRKVDVFFYAELVESDVELVAGAWKNHVRLSEIMSDGLTTSRLLELIDFAMKNDCTLPEFVSKAKELRL